MAPVGGMSEKHVGFRAGADFSGWFWGMKMLEVDVC